MPVYEYQCDKCGKVTEHLRQMSQADAPAVCEKCGSDKTHRVHSVFTASADTAGKSVSLPAGGCVSSRTTSARSIPRSSTFVGTARERRVPIGKKGATTQPPSGAAEVSAKPSPQPTPRLP